MTDGEKKNRQAERDVAAMCEKWWRKLESTCEFRRAMPAGGWPGEEGDDIRSSFAACGDLMTTAEKWPFAVVVKRRLGWNVDRLLGGENSSAWKWWKQAQSSTRELNAIAMLWLKKEKCRQRQPEFPWLVMLPREHFLVRRWSEDRLLPKPDATWTHAGLWAQQVDFGTALPALWFADRLLKTNPKRLIKISSGWIFKSS